MNDEAFNKCAKIYTQCIIDEIYKSLDCKNIPAVIDIEILKNKDKTYNFIPIFKENI